jgi:sugar phosphate isomerase/epimerase
MQLGFVTAILPDLSLEEVLAEAAAQGYDCVEVMCWPVGKAERRYAGVTHIDVTDFSEDDAQQVKALTEKYGVAISGLGYYPNPLVGDAEERERYAEHIKRVIRASALLGVNVMNTFIGRDHTRSPAENWQRFDQVWPAIVDYAEGQGVRIGIENCPMFFTGDEWPGGKNMAYSPAIWREMFKRIPSPNFGLNYDPSHLIWLQIDYTQPLWEFADRLVHVHAKDARVDRHRLDEVGILGTPLQFHTPKLPGLGDVDWGKFFSVLGDVGYKGPVCVEVEDRAFEDSLAERKRSLRQSIAYLRQFVT